MAANTANGIVAKQSKGGFVVAKFTSGGFIKPNHVTATIGANTVGETVQSMSIVSMQIATGGANSCYFEIRRGAMSREQAINLVRLYDGSYPENFVELYLDYYQMSRTEFDSVIDKWVNPDLFKKENGRWKPTFTIK